MNQQIATLEGTITHYMDDQIIAFTHYSTHSTIFVIANLKNISYEFILPFELFNTKWVNIIDNSIFEPMSSITVSPYSYMLLKLIEIE